MFVCVWVRVRAGAQEVQADAVKVGMAALSLEDKQAWQQQAQARQALALGQPGQVQGVSVQQDEGQAEQPDAEQAEQQDEGQAEQQDAEQAEQQDEGQAEQQDEEQAEQQDEGQAEQQDAEQAEQQDEGQAMELQEEGWEAKAARAEACATRLWDAGERDQAQDTLRSAVYRMNEYSCTNTEAKVRVDVHSCISVRIDA